VSAPLSLGAALKAAILAALLAALLATAWHELVSEPLIDQAIQLEALRQPAEMEPAPVSRDMQRIGLGVQLALYGLTWALALGGVFSLAQEALPGRGRGARAALLVGGAGWAVALLPFLKYPANPPGVGEPATLELRQVLYFGLMALGALGGAGALLLWHWLHRRPARTWAAQHPGPAALGAYGLFCLALLALLPSNPDPTPVPADLLLGFRLRAALGLVCFWAVFAAAFGLLVQRWSARPAAPRAVQQPAVPGAERS